MGYILKILRRFQTKCSTDGYAYFVLYEGVLYAVIGYQRKKKIRFAGSKIDNWFLTPSQPRRFGFAGSKIDCRY